MVGSPTLKYDNLLISLMSLFVLCNAISLISVPFQDCVVLLSRVPPVRGEAIELLPANYLFWNTMDELCDIHGEGWGD